MADGVLGRGLHLAKGQGAALRNEHRVIAETASAAGRPDQRAVDAAFEGFDMAIRPCQRKGADEMRMAVRSIAEFALNPLHRCRKIPLGPGPAGGMNSRRAAEGRDDQARIVGESRELGGACRRRGLDRGVLGKSGADLLRLRQAQLGGGNRPEATGPQQLFDFAHFAGVVARDHQPTALATPSHETPRPQPCRASAWRWCSKSCAAPCRASSSMASSRAWSKTRVSAVAWTSTRPPLAVSTKLASTSAVESSV